MIGKILGNRYQVVEKIGDGGTAFVFKGMDNLLNRHVTVKVLRPEYVSDQDFVRRFRREAQAAASLSHPNIVSIYDVGVEDGIHYIVMEYIQGQSLKELIEELGHLPVTMAAEYGYQIAQALGNAHKHGIIHRDVKPHNILISEDGRVKVTDFGIAQAVTASTVTYNGAILGSVHYFSPEQARGGQTAEKSDLYSLGVVLFEMLTGQIPYSGDSPVTVALKHLQEPFPKPRDINPDIPVAMERIVRKAVEKDPDNRYHSAREIADELMNFMHGRENPVKPELPQVKTVEEHPGKKQKKSRMKRWQWAAIAAALLMVALFIFGLVRLQGHFVVPDVDVPNVEGESLARAGDILETEGLRYRVADQQASETIPSGHVISQSPIAGRTVKKDREIDLIVSTGPDLVEVEDVEGKMVREATLILEAKGFVVEPVEQHSDKPPGTVITQDPGKGHRISKGSTITLHISKGGRPFRIADLRGLTLEDAQNWLTLFGLKPGFVNEKNSETFAPGLVMAQYPEPDELVQAGDIVDLTLSKGPEKATVEKHEIKIKTSEIPDGEEVTVVINDFYRERTETFIKENDEPYITFGWGNGVVEVRWQDKIEIKDFP